jgi:hypothetical protein
MLRSITALAALALAVSPAAAQAPAAFFTAELAAPTAETQFAAGGVVWRCEGTNCRAPRSTARALRICSSLRREAGAVVRFTADGGELDAETLARCNG